MKPAETQAQKAPKLVDIDRLSQAEVARLINRPTSFIRCNEHWFERDAGGKYSARQVVEALLANQPAQELEPLELDDATLELFLQSTFSAAIDWHCRSATVKRLDLLIEEHGDAALAAFGSVMLDAIREALDRQGDEHPSQSVNGDREALQAEAAEWVEEQLQRFREFATRRAGRTVDVCPDCKTYRFGRKRRSLPVPPGYIGDMDQGFFCDQCEAKRLLRK